MKPDAHYLVRADGLKYLYGPGEQARNNMAAGDTLQALYALTPAEAEDVADMRLEYAQAVEFVGMVTWASMQIFGRPDEHLKATTILAQRVVEQMEAAKNAVQG